jgi:hypothetical protein
MHECVYKTFRRVALLTSSRESGTLASRAKNKTLHGYHRHEAKRIKPSTSPESEIPPAANGDDETNETNGQNGKSSNEPVIPFPEKPAVIEERNGDIAFYVVNNDGRNLYEASDLGNSLSPVALQLIVYSRHLA